MAAAGWAKAAKASLSRPIARSAVPTATIYGPRVMVGTADERRDQMKCLGRLCPPLYGASCQARLWLVTSFLSDPFFLSPVSLFDRRTVSSSRPCAAPVTPRADAVKDGHALPLSACRHVRRDGGHAERGRAWPSPEATQSVLYSVEHGVTLIRVGTVRPTLGRLAAADAVLGEARRIRGEPAVGERRTSPHNLVFGGPFRRPRP